MSEKTRVGISKKAFNSLMDIYTASQDTPLYNKEEVLTENLEDIQELRMLAIKELKGVFSKNELNGIINALKSKSIGSNISPNYQLIKTMEDADYFFANSKVYQYDIEVLLDKIKSLTTTQAFFLLREVVRRHWKYNIPLEEIYRLFVNN